MGRAEDFVVLLTLPVASTDALLLPVVCGSLLIFFHVALTWRAALCLIQRIQGDGKGKQIADALDANELPEDVDIKLVTSWRDAASYVVHLHLMPMLASATRWLLRPDICTLLWLVVCCFLYAAYLLTIRDAVHVTKRRVQVVCMLAHGCIVALMLSNIWDTTQDFHPRTVMLLVGELFISWICPDAYVVSSAVGFVAAHGLATAYVQGCEAFSFLFNVQLLLELLLDIAVPVIVRRVHREQVAAYHQSKDAESLVLAFRQMLKGVCDGDMLLDSNFKICGSSSGLQHLLGSHETLAGRKITELLAPDDAMKQKFEKFLNGSAMSTPTSPPRCLRVALKAMAGHEIPVDVLHVRLRLHGDTVQHLLAITGDAESQPQPEAEEDAIPTSLLSKAPSPRHLSQTSSQSGSVEFYDELSDLTILLNASTELLDIEEAHLRFVRHSEAPEMKMGMPSLKRFLRPLDWQTLEPQLRQFAHSVKHCREPSPQALPPVIVNLPGEPKTRLQARSVCVKSLYSGPRPQGKPAYLYLHLRKFNGGHKKRKTNLEGVEEDTQMDMTAYSSSKEDANAICSDPSAGVKP